MTFEASPWGYTITRFPAATCARQLRGLAQFLEVARKARLELEERGRGGEGGTGEE